MMKFIADHMLGRLATWMRMIGCDVVYDPRVGDDELIERAQRENRIILTRDTFLIQRKMARENAFFIQGDGYKDQLLQVIRRFSIDPAQGFLSRCLRCNFPLSRIEKRAVEGRVPPYVFLTQEHFHTCLGCNKLYWPATHKEAMVRQLQEILCRDIR